MIIKHLEHVTLRITHRKHMVQVVSGVKNVDIETQLRHQKVKHQKEKSKSANPIQSENLL